MTFTGTRFGTFPFLLFDFAVIALLLSLCCYRFAVIDWPFQGDTLPLLPFLALFTSTCNRTITSTMPEKFDYFKADLFEVVYLVLQPKLTQEQKDGIVAGLNSRGHAFTWNAIRYCSFLLYLFPSQLYHFTTSPLHHLLCLDTRILLPAIHHAFLRRHQGRSARCHLPGRPASLAGAEGRGHPHPELARASHGLERRPVQLLLPQCLPCFLGLSTQHKLVSFHLKHTHSNPSLKMAATRKLQNWSPETHEDILISLLEHIKPGPQDWAHVMASLQARGHTFTESALKYDRVSLPFPSSRFHFSSSAVFSLLSRASTIPPIKTSTIFSAGNVPYDRLSLQNGHHLGRGCSPLPSTGGLPPRDIHFR